MDFRKLKISALGLVVASAFALGTPPSDAKAQITGPTLADILISASGGGDFDNRPRDYDIIVQVLIALEDLGGDPDLGGATLLDVVSDPNATVTVFVPRDRAFRRLASDLGWDGTGGDAGAFGVIAGAFDLETIRNVVKYHVVGRPLSFLDVVLTNTFDTVLPGASFERRFFSLIDNEPDLKDPRLTFPLQIQGGQSIAHTINRVLVPVDLP